MTKTLTKLIGAGILVGALLYGCKSENKDLPVNTQTRKIIQSYSEQRVAPAVYATDVEGFVKQYRENIDFALKTFNQGISDKNYTLDEQLTTWQGFRNAEKCLEKIAVLDDYGKYLRYWKSSRDGEIHIDNINDSRLKLNERESNLKYLIDKNVNDIDIRTPELEKELVNQGLDVKVESTGAPEAGLGALFGILSLGIFAVSYPFIRLVSRG
ncbi:MAG: hypothetical protein AABX11_05000 [Nanoarchaeota archaeon]